MNESSGHSGDISESSLRSGDISVSSKTLGHISAGLYRSTAGAIKELVSNAFDANATVVRITTNWPRFHPITCSDDGDGMTIDQFEALMKGGIGDSSKREEGRQVTRTGRPIIGRIGIGIFGIAQFCYEFQIWSHHRETETGFWARVQLIDYLQEKIDQTEAGKEADYDVGRYECEAIQYDADKAGLTVVATDVKKGFVQRFAASPGKRLPRDFRQALKKYTACRSVQQLGDYWNMVWQLCVVCPVTYVETGPVRGENAIPEIRQELEDYNFRVVVDGMRLYRPPLLPSPYRRDGWNHRLYPISTDSEVDGKRLRLGGYLFMQDGFAVVPAELRGVLVRVKNVGIGSYDKSLFDYPIAQGPRFGWISGEIYGLEGLEDALNVDRDSFNESHPHFLEVRTILHEKLEAIFSQVYKDMRARSGRDESKRAARRQELFRQQIADVAGEAYDIHESAGTQETAVAVDAESRTIFVNPEGPWPSKAGDRELAQQLAVAYELSQSARTRNGKRDTFLNLLGRVLKIHGRW